MVAEKVLEQIEFLEEENRKALLVDTFSPDRVEKFVMGEATLGQLYGITMDEAYSVAQFGYTFLEQGKYKQAQTIFQALVLSNPYDGYFHELLGSVYQRLGMHTGAIEEYTLAVALDPANIPSWVNRGELFMQKGDFQQAASDFKKAVDLDPAGTHPSANRARALAGATLAALKNVS